MEEFINGVVDTLLNFIWPCTECVHELSEAAKPECPYLDSSSSVGMAEKFYSRGGA